MRIMQAYVRIHIEYKKYATDLDTIIEVFCINLNDPSVKAHGPVPYCASQLATQTPSTSLKYSWTSEQVECTSLISHQVAEPSSPTPKGSTCTPPKNRQLEDYEATIRYIAALAGLKLWGDC
ncbi:hypothetical protein E1B28_002046 [Marasmius oreades]|uniref:Uncharacterized protein n=1 Tax=Marasmius oreades TaxID=181124 RepID=A0A9P8AGA2_9AGAR|nr:uncharacterized protein E1B28_002046 [Marasmius oreades]KAG7100273.1 hypothetical protein E1B28_002046 [Marasmius oreades]